MGFWVFIWNMLTTLFSFFFLLTVFTVPFILLTSFLLNKNIIKNEWLISLANLIVGVLIAPGLTVYLVAVNPQILDRFYDKLWRYKATEIVIQFNKEPTHSETQDALTSVVNAFPELKREYAVKRAIGRYTGTQGRLVGSAQVMPHYWKKEGTQLFIYLSAPLSRLQREHTTQDIKQRFFGHNSVLSPLIKTERQQSTEAFFLNYIHELPTTINNTVKLSSIDKRLLVYPKTYFISAAFNKEFDEPTAECSVKFLIDGDYWDTQLQSTTQSLLTDKHKISRKTLELGNANQQEVRQALRQLFFKLKFKAMLSNGDSYPASIFITEEGETHLVLTLKKYYEEIYRASDTEYECFTLIRETPIFHNALVQSHYMTDFPASPDMKSIAIRVRKFSPFYTKVMAVTTQQQ